MFCSGASQHKKEMTSQVGWASLCECVCLCGLISFNELPYRTDKALCDQCVLMSGRLAGASISTARLTLFYGPAATNLAHPDESSGAFGRPDRSERLHLPPNLLPLPLLCVRGAATSPQTLPTHCKPLINKTSTSIPHWPRLAASPCMNITPTYTQHQQSLLWSTHPRWGWLSFHGCPRGETLKG